VNKEVRQLIKACKKQGIKIEATKSGHYKATRGGCSGSVIIAGTASDHLSIKNTIAQLRKTLGFKWKGR
jgi:hypothetical protein